MHPNEFPEHKIALWLVHNNHKIYCTSIVDFYEHSGLVSEDWLDAEQRKLAIDNDDVWELSWYPDNTIESYTLLAHDVDKLLKRSREIELS